MKKFLLKLVAACAALAVCAGFCGCAAAGYTVFDDVECFSGDIMFSARILGGRADYAHRRMIEVITEINAQVSATRADSDVARFNSAPAGDRVSVGKHAYRLFNLSREYYDVTDGAFNCAAAPLAELWRVDAQSISQYRPDIDGSYISPPLPSAEQVGEVLPHCDPRLITGEERDGKFYLTKTDERVKLDFGGIAKGYAVDECVKILKEYEITSALLDISGNAYFYGRRVDNGQNEDWHVGIMSPRPRGGTAQARGYVCATSVCGDASAVTSGDYMRYYIHDKTDGQKLYVPHIIGTNGVPIGVASDGTDWRNADEWVMSATVIGDNSALCDALSTAVCALGLEHGAQLLKKVGYKGLIFTEKRYTIIGDVQFYKPDVYDGFTEYAFYEL